MSRILELLKLAPSAQSLDYVENKGQFHLFSLLTEQRHPKTWNLSFVLQSDIQAGLGMLLSVDRDVARRIEELAGEPGALEQAAEAIVAAIRSGHRIYIYGCGATGRLAKQVESNFWRPFWRKAQRKRCWEKLRQAFPEDIENRLTGEMTGADRALVSSLEGFEDLQLIGRLQLAEHRIRRGDVVICVTEGGETSSVIGTALGALAQYGPLDDAAMDEARRRLYFIYNNPDALLVPFERSALVLNNPGITKINLATGPQAITGSTRLQATTSETFVVGVILEEALCRLLREHLTEQEMSELDFPGNPGVAARLRTFSQAKDAVDRALPAIAQFTALEAGTFRRSRFATYFAKEALITVFIDNTERSPTFRLYPLDRVQDRERKCWVQVWTEASDQREAWLNFLGRSFRGLDPDIYRRPFEEEVDDPYLRDAALRSLANAGNDQEFSYDFSFSPANIARRGPQPGDLGVAVFVGEEIREMEDPASSFRRFVKLCHEQAARVAIVVVADPRRSATVKDQCSPHMRSDDVLVHLELDTDEDPIGLRRQIALKMMLNAHSTAIMAAVGRVIGNTMTSVSPSNLKLIGRATYLIQSHVNDTRKQPEWAADHGPAPPLAFAEANAVLMEAMEHVRAQDAGQTAEVALSIIRIVEAQCRSDWVSWEESRAILEEEGLASFLARHNPALTRIPSEPR